LVFHTCLAHVFSLPPGGGLLLDLLPVAASAWTLIGPTAQIDSAAARGRLTGAVPERLCGGVLAAPSGVLGGILLWRRAPLGFAGGPGLLISLGALFTGSTAVMTPQPAVSGTAFSAADTIIVAVMGAVCSIPFVLFLRGSVSGGGAESGPPHLERREPMKILGISGSPRKNGNTAFAVQRALETARSEGAEARFLSLAGMQIHPCTGCWSCQKDRLCVFKDDMAGVLDELRSCDGLILASPVYFGMVSGLMKNMMDRTVPLRPNYGEPLELAGKVGGGIACGGFRNGGQETTLQNIHTFLLQQNMRVVNDGAGFSHAGGTIAGEAGDDALGLQTIDNLARNMIFMLKKQ
jgi:multimeric flavodoxin WrbA